MAAIHHHYHHWWSSTNHSSSYLQANQYISTSTIKIIIHTLRTKIQQCVVSMWNKNYVSLLLWGTRSRYGVHLMVMLSVYTWISHQMRYRHSNSIFSKKEWLWATPRATLLYIIQLMELRWKHWVNIVDRLLISSLHRMIRILIYSSAVV